MTPAGTYRITLTHEQSGRVTFDHAGLSGERVEQIIAFIVEAWPAIQAARGAVAAANGIREALAGLEQLGVTRATRPRRRR